ncbi:MAG: TolC family protein [Acidobacteriia bacterium]|nr:TolC family protein [Terriglobia bacterium]
MQRSSVFSSLRQASALLLAAVMVPAGWAQDSSSAPNAPSQAQKAVPSSSQPFDLKEYSQPRSHFPNPLAPYTPRTVAPPNLANTARIDQLMRDGKLYLSMNDAVALALENNLDIAIARYNLNIADTDIWRAQAGSSTRGVNTGIVQGTPGGTGTGVGTTSTGGGAGGTTTGTGGAGTGTAGLVTSTTGVGALVPSFDPMITGTFQLDRNTIQATSAFSGNPFTSQNTGTADLAYTQGFHWGTNLSVGFNNTRTTTNSPYSLLTPQLASNFRFTLSQPLLSGFGFLSNTRFIKIAKNNREISDVAFRLQVITTVNQIQNIYWDLVNAYENVKVQQDSLGLAQKTLSDNQKQVEIGTLAPIEVVRAQSVVATNQQSLIVAQTNLQLQQLLIKNALSRTLADPALGDAEVIPTDTMSVPDKEPIIPTQDLLNEALAHRAELAESRIDLTNRDITNRSAKNALLPTLSVFAYYGGTGAGGNLNPNAPLCTPTSTGFCVDPTKIPPTFKNGNVSYGATFGQMFDSTAPDKGAGLQLNIPLRNRSAQADQVRAQLEYRQAQMSLQQQENKIRIEVRQAQFSVQQSRAAVEAARAAVELAKQSLDAEQKKYALGASTTTAVLQTERDLTQAKSNLVTANSTYEKSRVELDRSIGATLDRLGILMNDAERGQVTKMPAVPYVAPRPAEQEKPVQPPAQPQQ